MDIEQYLTKKKTIYQLLMDYLDSDANIEEKFQSLATFLAENNILLDRNELKEFFTMLVEISNFHFRVGGFYGKIDHLLSTYEKELKLFFSNAEIFGLFNSNKRLLLFLSENDIFKFNEDYAEITLSNKFTRENYPYYLYGFIRDHVDFQMRTFIQDQIKKINFDYESERFRRFQLKGENEAKICELIRKDSLDDFVDYVRKKRKLLMTIRPSIFETNKFLLLRPPEYIEYAAFYGSYEIFKYLYSSDCESKATLWLYAIHGRNPEIFHFLERNRIMPTDESFKECLYESIRCHHSDFTQYFLKNKVVKDSKNDNEFDIICLKFRNYNFFPPNFNNQFIFFNLCRYNHIGLVKLLLKSKNLDYDVNTLVVFFRLCFLIGFFILVCFELCLNVCLFLNEIRV